jgi:hypothetical protein
MTVILEGYIKVPLEELETIKRLAEDVCQIEQNNSSSGSSN